MEILMAVAVAFHLIFAVIWVGGMFFAVYVMRLAAAPMEPPDRIGLWERGFQKFFPWVWCSIIILPLTGYYMAFAAYGGFANLPIPYHLMHGLGWIMIAIFLHLWFAPYKRFKAHIAGGNIPEAAKNLNSIRLLVTTNLYIGLVNGLIGASGHYWG